MQDLTKFLSAHNFFIEPELDGVLRRHDRNGKKNNAWFVGHKWEMEDKTFVFAKFGDWSTGETLEWKSDQNYSPEQLKEFNKRIREQQQKHEEQKAKVQKEVSQEAQKIWDRAKTNGSTNYMSKKKIDKLFGARIDPDRPENLLVPLRDVEGKLWNLQKILPEKLKPNNIDKIFLEGGRIRGLHCTFGEIFPKGRIFICEGFATGYSIFSATTHAVCCAFNADNILHVAKAIREKYPESQITICADNDQWTKKKDGTPWNVGREKATYAALVVKAAKVYPKFKSLFSHPTDFNDLHALEGLSEVKTQILEAAPSKELEPILELSNNGAVKKPSEYKVVKTLVDHFDNSLVQQDGELFKFVNTHWQHLGDEDTRGIKKLLSFLASETFKINEIEAAYKRFLLEVPVAPRNMFQPNPFYANFLNGTLVISKLPDSNTYGRTFKEHSYADYIANVIPLNYEPHKCEVNVEFHKCIDRLFFGDKDKDSKIKSLKELFGSCLTPLFPRIFLLVGPPGSGKSTVAILASKLVSDTNLSMVEPHEFRGFHMESMLGKLVNISTDIRTNEPIDDAMMKKIEDRVPVRIDRKFKTPVRAWLPAIHIFGANKLPPNYEGDSKAFTRRTTILEFKSFKAEGLFNRNFAQEVFESNPQGFLNFALEGLDILLANGGHFSNPESGAEALDEWQLDYDPVGQFFKDLYQGEIEGQSKLEAGSQLDIERKLLWENFVKWHEESTGRHPHFSKHKFYKQVGARFCSVVVVRGVRYFRGVAVRESASSKF